MHTHNLSTKNEGNTWEAYVWVDNEQREFELDLWKKKFQILLKYVMPHAYFFSQNEQSLEYNRLFKNTLVPESVVKHHRCRLEFGRCPDRISAAVPAIITQHLWFSSVPTANCQLKSFGKVTIAYL